MAFTWRFAATLVQLGKNTPTYRFLSLSSLRTGTVVPFKLSDIGEGIRDVTVKEWFVKPGDRVSQFDNICEVQSDKASVTITSRYDGLVKKLYYQIDEVALVGNPLVDIELDDDVDDKSTKKTDEIKDTIEDGEVKKYTRKDDDINNERTRKNVERVTTNQEMERALATPAVRRIAMENNINLKDVIATGKAGRVLKEDILADVHKLSESKSDQKTKEKEREQGMVMGQFVPLKRYSKHMWKTMTQSLSIPHFVYSDECNVTELMRYRDEVKESLKQQGVSLTLMPFFIKAASRVLEQIPNLNAWVDEENQAIRVFDNHNIGVAMDTPEGLVVPNIKNVQDLSVIDIAKELNRLQALGKKASIPLNDVTNGTFSLSNIGVVGGTYTKPVILPPQVVIGAFGKVQKLPRFDVKGNVVAANILSVSWSADHRVVDGMTMARFSNLWKHYVENPVFLLIEA